MVNETEEIKPNQIITVQNSGSALRSPREFNVESDNPKKEWEDWIEDFRWYATASGLAEKS